MRIEDVRKFFADTSPDIPWDRAVKDGWGVSVMVADETDNWLDDTCLLWTKDGRRGAGGRAIRLGDLRTSFDAVGAKWRAKVFRLASQFCEEPLPVSFAVLVVGDVIFDGCHRASAALVSGAPYRIMVVEIVPKGGALWKSSDLK